MAFCVNCGTKLPESAKFCANCGTPAVTGPASPAPAEKTAEERNKGEAFSELMEKAGELLRAGGSAQNPVAKNVAGAIAICTNIIEQDESYPGVWTKRGLAKIMGFRYFDAEYLDDESFKNYNQILPDFDRAIEEDEEDGEAYAYRAEIHWRCGRSDAALEDLQRAFDLSGKGWAATAEEMYNDGVELPEEIIDGLRDEGYIDSEDDEDDEEEEDDD
jgi:tetratricopeptide (TPR) repeat protein